MNLYFLLTIAACVVAGLAVMYFERREQKRLYSRMLEKQQKMIADFDMKAKALAQAAVTSSIAQFELGVRAGRRMQLRDMAHTQSVLAFLAKNGDAAALRAVSFLRGEGRN